jgi:hypothetical protein
MRLNGLDSEKGLEDLLNGYEAHAVFSPLLMWMIVRF